MWFSSSKTKTLVRLAAVGTLEDAGFDMIEAANSGEAIELLEADSNVQLLFTDINMPGAIDGLALAREVHARWPHISIIVTSTRSTPPEMPAGSRYHQKPYSPATVVKHAQELTSA